MFFCVAKATVIVPFLSVSLFLKYATSIVLHIMLHVGLHFVRI